MIEMKIIPDKLILLNVSGSVSTEKIRKNLKSDESLIHYKDEEIGTFAQSALLEYQVHVEGVKDVCRGSITEIDGNKPEGIILEEIARIIKLQRSNAPRRPQRIILLGPPGSRKTAHAKRIAEKY